MNSRSVKGMTVEELVAQFVTIAIDQDQALFMDDVKGFNDLYDRMTAVCEELKGRPGDGRRALLSLYQHPNLQVRLKAAINTLSVAHTRARGMLQSIFDLQRMPQAADAGFIIHGLDDGSFVPK